MRVGTLHAESLPLILMNVKVKSETENYADAARSSQRRNGDCDPHEAQIDISVNLPRTSFALPLTAHPLTSHPLFPLQGD